MRSFTVLAVVASAAFLGSVGCGDNEHPAVAIGGTVSGLAGSGLVLQNNGHDDLMIAADGTFKFATSVANGSGYAVTVKTQPSSPDQTCMVTNGSGTASSEVTDIAVTCTIGAFTVGGMVSGLSGTGLVLENNGTDDLSVAADGTFTFPTRVASGAGFVVTVKTQPMGPAQVCSVSGGTGTVGTANVTTVVVNCATDKFTIGGTTSGLAGTVVLQNNAGDNITVTANGSFAFPTTVASGATYTVTVLTQPATPDQTCTVTNGTGTVATANITSVVVTCTTNTFAIRGTVAGLLGTGLVLQDNGGDDLMIAGDGTFVFATKVASGATFDVTVLTQPAGPTQSCTVAGATGTVGNADVTSVLVNCMTNRYAIGGTISGLVGTVILQNNGADDLTVTADGMFSFATPVASGATYSVTVLTQPGSPSQTCSVTAGSGTVTTADITSVVVTCTTNRYTIGGTLSGLAAGESVVLRDNGADDLMVSANGDFTFGTTVPSGQPYAVTVFTNPAAPISETCVVTNDSGTVGGTNVTNVVVTCTPTKFTVGGTVAGLVGSVVLQNNGGDNLTINADGPFTFATPVDSGATYAVTVATQPAGGSCTVANGSGTIGGMNVTTVTVTCTSSCRAVNGILWCYDSAACGESCNQVCAALGLPFTIDDTTWFNAQSTAPQCQAINDAFGLGGTVQMSSFTYACSEDQSGTHTAPGGLGSPLLCSTYSGCPSAHRTTMDQLGVSCGSSSRRSLCPCQ